MSKLETLSSAVESGKARQIPELVRVALESGAAPMEVLNAMTQAMDRVGEKFKTGEIFVPEMLVAARAMTRGVETLQPVLSDGEVIRRGKLIIGTVRGDLHDIGKNLVIMMMESVGFEVVDLGVDVTPAKFTAMAADPSVDLVGVSALLTTTMPAMRETVRQLNALPNRKQFKVMVGGAPVTQVFCDEIGADIYTADAASAARRACQEVTA